MANMTIREAIIREIEALPEARQADVLAFIRFLKIGLADEQTVERRFTDAVTYARAVALKQGITEQDIEEEIRAVRAQS